MIEYDYTIDRDEGDERRTFFPTEIPKSLDNLVYIEGPNSSGKSTLLNIIGLGLYGTKNESIPDGLRRKMENLLNSDHQDLQFKLKITDKGKELELVSEKKDLKTHEFKLYEKQKGKRRLLSKETFQNRYNLIYDIPDDPTARLSQLTSEIKDAQNLYSNRLSDLSGSIRDTINAVRECKNPEAIEKSKATLERVKAGNANLQGEINAATENLNTLEPAVYWHYFNKYYGEYEEIQKKIQNLDNSITKTVRKKKRANKEYDGLIKQLQEEQYGMQKLFDETTQLLKKLCPNEKNHLNIWGRINIYDNFRNRRFDDNLFDEIEAFLMFIEKANQRKEQNHSIQEAKVYRALIDLLEDYRDTNIELPGINKTISEFIYDLKKSADKCEPERVFLANSDRARELLLQLKENRARITTEIFRKIRDIESDLSDDSGYNPEEDSKLKEISRLSDELGAIEKKVGEFEVKYAQIGKPDPSGICELGKGPLQDYVSYTEQQLLDFISDLKEDLRTKTGRFNNTITKIKLHEKLIKGLEGKEQHKYQDNLDGLNKLLEVCDSLLRKFRKKYTDYISDIIDHNVITGKVDADQLKYNNAVSDYLGKRVGFLRHLDTEHKLEKIDLVAGLAITDKGKKIKLEDMGTGQSQSAYLLGKLNTSDNRKIIALFDEVAMMDTKSLAPIYKRFEELYNENRLIVGIVVQKADKTCIKPLVKGHKK